MDHNKEAQPEFRPPVFWTGIFESALRLDGQKYYYIEQINKTLVLCLYVIVNIVLGFYVSIKIV